MLECLHRDRCRISHSCTYCSVSLAGSRNFDIKHSALPLIQTGKHVTPILAFEIFAQFQESWGGRTVLGECVSADKHQIRGGVVVSSLALEGP